MGAAIRELVDVQGLKYVPDIWARTGLVPARAQALYKAAAPKRKAAPRRKAAAVK